MFHAPGRWLLLIALVALPCGTANAVLLDSVPGNYIPGGTFAFTLRLPATTGLATYNIDLVLESNVGTAGTDFYFDVAATVPSPTDYVFPSTANYFDAINVESTAHHRLTLSDFDFGGVNVVPGNNELVANIFVETSPSFSGPLSIWIDTDPLVFILYNTDDLPVDEAESIVQAINAQGPYSIHPIPEPNSLALTTMFAIGWKAITRRRKFR